MKKAITYLGITSVLIASGVWVGSHIQRTIKTEEKVDITYEAISPADELIQRLNPRIDPSVRIVIARSIDRECASQGVDSELVVSLINRESSFVPWSISTKNGKPCAYGLMQVYPKAHPELCNNLTPVQLCNIDTNIMLGVKILKGCIERAGSIQAALGLYYGSQEHTGYKLDILSDVATLYAMR